MDDEVPKSSPLLPGKPGGWRIVHRLKRYDGPAAPSLQAGEASSAGFGSKAAVNTASGGSS